MLRLVHLQTVLGPILIDDIDDGLPNKLYHRLGSTADPKAYVRDGIIDKPKQACYVPRTQTDQGFPLVPGYINLQETRRVIHSAGKGKIFGFHQSGHIDVVSLIAADIIAPVLAVAQINVPLPGDLTLTGSTFVSITPDVTTIFITGNVTITLVTPPPPVGAATIVIPAALVPGIAIGVSFVQVLANEQLTAIVPVTP